MVRSRWIKAVLATLVSTGLAWGQSAGPSSPQPPDDPTGRIITVNEAGKPGQKCRVVKWWVDDKGNKVWQVEALDTGEVMTIIASGAPVMGEPPAAGRPKALRTQIFHWGRDRTPPPGAPLPPGTAYAGGPGSPACDNCKPSGGCGPVVTEIKTPVIVTQPGSAGTTGPGVTARLPVIETRPGKPASGSRGGDGCVCDPPGSPTVVTVPSRSGETKVAQAEPSALSKWRESWGKGETPKMPAADTSKAADTKKPAPPPKLDLPHADTKKPDPLLGDPTQYARKPLDEKLPPKGDLPKTDLPKVASGKNDAPPAGKGDLPALPGAGERLPAGGKSVTDSGAVQYVPVPVVTLPPINMGPPPRPPMPQWQVPQAPQPINPARGNAPEAAQGGVAYNAFTPYEQVPPPPGSPMASLKANAFSSDYDSIQPAPHAVPAGPPAAGVFGPAGQPYPAMMAQAGPRPMSPMLPPSPFGPVVKLPMPPAPPSPMTQGTQVAMAPPSPAAGVTQTSYQGAAAQPSPMPGSAPAAGMASPQLMGVLRDSLYPSQREWAAEKLSDLDWKQNDAAVQALTRAVREDPAATVRAGCVRALAKMKANTYPVVSAVQAAKNDADTRVRTEAEEALAVLAPGMKTPAAPPPAQVVQPVGAVVPAAPPMTGPSLPPLSK